MIEDACSALREGKIVLLYDFDDRERETDLIIRADAVTPKDVLTMRRDGGGLICTAVHPEAAKRLGLPFASDLMQGFGAVEHLGDIPYDRKNHSSFSIWVNHRSTYTGIPDRDRATTINAIADQVKISLNGGGQNFAAEFRTPGHVAILRAAEGLLDVRRGQTELSIALAEQAGLTPAVVVCEMLDDETGLALTKEDAMAYAEEHGLVFIEGKEVLEHWEEMNAARNA
ncbi:3,4-dihydroxy-2-butanone-4-phosphate synthase [Methanofollis formosanus]|uniref:3,4-dihydroxy-2-butanone 4-phosphate synthase n=1 Tax=Methanofollis formosanus TaxID=299308 RepID=A0A8G1EG60_9EURY|nr:3,4-dihydroxy-2-butanone-4-phosphate synthase [Methanofollis formosanus]QYZ79498.1 3,4-dihydroxy-2-butanone-4-phosphate synthase [Methanofollis formosanus]